MSQPLDASHLVDLVHRYYPRDIDSTAPGYHESEQFQHLLTTRKKAQEQRSGSWKAFLRRLQESLPACKIEDWTVLWSDDNCWRARVYLPGPVEVSGGQEHRAVVLLVSILAPVYVLYSSFHLRVGDGRFQQPRLFYEDVPETKHVADVIDTLARQELDMERLSNATLFTPVPDLQCRNVALGEAKLIDCLFTDDRW